MPKVYDKEFKEKVVARAKQIGAAKAGKENGVSERTAQSWVQAAEGNKPVHCPGARENRNGEFSPRFDKKTSERIQRYCKAKGLNKTHFVIACINERLDQLEDEMLTTLSKEELIRMIRELR